MILNANKSMRETKTRHNSLKTKVEKVIFSTWVDDSKILRTKPKTVFINVYYKTTFVTFFYFYPWSN
jgi:hypothetical protein